MSYVTPFGTITGSGGDTNPLDAFNPHGTGAGYTVSNTPAPVPQAPGFSLPNPFMSGLPAGLNQQYFATPSTAAVIAALLGGTARQESDPNAGAEFSVWVIDFFSATGQKRITWNAGDLYLYLQKHSGYTVPV